VHDTIDPHILEGFQVEIRGRKQDKGKRFNKQSSTVERIAIDRKITFEACICFTMEVQKPCVAYNNGVKEKNKTEKELQTVYEHESS